jgi:hypothetical protein
MLQIQIGQQFVELVIGVGGDEAGRTMLRGRRHESMHALSYTHGCATQDRQLVEIGHVVVDHNELTVPGGQEGAQWLPVVPTAG